MRTFKTFSRDKRETCKEKGFYVKQISPRKDLLKKALWDISSESFDSRPQAAAKQSGTYHA